MRERARYDVRWVALRVPGFWESDPLSLSSRHSTESIVTHKLVHNAGVVRATVRQ